ncbi:hypothetical protein BD410DRAFT_780189 [Rickenella mellea]|uniref:Uncharacterized protein n=1 Tax=Rickenella mellea TaxID=50990 RepID=A0A4R5XHG9_9AGAM|nr:hypothetical protein BD410DRAFT_780189 [Rickenella mellea]
MSSPTRRRTSLNKNKSNAPPGFRPMSKPHDIPIGSLSVRELHDRYNRNQEILARPCVFRVSSLSPHSKSHGTRFPHFGVLPSPVFACVPHRSGTSTAAPRIKAEQAEIETRLIGIEGVDGIGKSLRNTHISADDDMNVDHDPEPFVSPTLMAKQKALANFATPLGYGNRNGSFGIQEAMDLEREAHMRDQERQQRTMEKRRKQGKVLDGERLTREEAEARMWAFMTYKPTESDLEDEDDDDEDSDSEDISSWFEDDQDDGRKGQNIVDPDADDLADIIRIDESKVHFNTLYEPHDEGD